MLRVSLVALFFVAAVGALGCGGDDRPPITGPVTLYVATEPHGGSFRAWFDGLTTQDFAQLTTTYPINIKVTGFADNSRREVFATLEGSYDRKETSTTMTLEVENHQELKLHINGLKDPVVKETSAGGKVIGPEDSIPAGKHTFQVTARIG